MPTIMAAGNFHGADACDTGYDDGCAGNRGHGTAQGAAQSSHGTHLHDGHTEVCRMGRNRFVERKGRRIAGTGDQTQQEGTYGCADLNDRRIVDHGGDKRLDQTHSIHTGYEHACRQNDTDDISVGFAQVRVTMQVRMAPMTIAWATPILNMGTILVAPKIRIAMGTTGIRA